MLLAKVIDKNNRTLCKGAIGKCINFRAGLEPDYMKPRELKIVVDDSKRSKKLQESRDED